MTEQRVADEALDQSFRLVSSQLLGLAEPKRSSPQDKSHSDHPMHDADLCLGILDASRNGDLARVQQILNDGAEIDSQDIFDGYTPLHYAIGSGNTHLVRLLIERGADIEHKNNTVYQTPLCTAVLSGKSDMVEILLQAGANAGARLYADGQSLVEAAMQDGNESIARLLLRRIQ